MLFSEKMAQIPQPSRRALWDEYRTLCTALALNVTLKKESRIPTEAELRPLREAAEKANEILGNFGISPSFCPHSSDFFPCLLEELTAIMNTPSTKD